MDIRKIDEFLTKLACDPKFKQKVIQDQAAARKSGVQYGRPVSGSGFGIAIGALEEEEAKARVAEITHRIEKAIRQRLPSISANMFNIYGPFELPDGRWQFKIFFKADVVHRESLYREGYPDGLENLVLFYSKGMKEPAKNPVWNRAALEWNYNRAPITLSRKMRKQNKTTTYQRKPPQQVAEYRAGAHYFIPAGWQRMPDPFLVDAIAAINAEMAKDDVSVILDSAYYP